MAGSDLLPALKPEWQSAIADLFIERMSAPFVWGLNDCCLLAADAKLAATGVDPAEGFRTYDDALSAARLVSKLGGMEAIGSRFFGPRIPVECVAFGDIGLIENCGRPCLAVFGGQFFHAPAEHGLTILPIEHCAAAWRLTG